MGQPVTSASNRPDTSTNTPPSADDRARLHHGRQRRHAAKGIALALVVLVAGIFALFTNNDEPGEESQTADKFGIRHLYRSTPAGMIWTSNWEGRRSFHGKDPADPWFDAHNDAATYKVADGQLAISGDVPRMFISDPERKRQWRDVEITMYFKRVADDGVDYAGMVSVARSNHGVTGDEAEDACDSRGLGARMRYDGFVDFDKETVHPDAAVAAQKPLWRDGMPQNVWLGYKHVVYDLPNGAVRQELWLDRSGGKDGGNWVKINQITDDGNLFGEAPCAPGIDPRMPLTNDSERPGSESGKPNISVYFRSDGVGEDGLLYKWGSVREIRTPHGTA